MGASEPVKWAAVAATLLGTLIERWFAVQAHAAEGAAAQAAYVSLLEVVGRVCR